MLCAMSNLLSQQTLLARMLQTSKSRALFTRAGAAETAAGSTPDINTSEVGNVAIDVNVTAVSGTTPSLALVVDRLGSDGIYYQIHAFAAITAAGKASVNLGPGATVNAIPGNAIRLRWTVTGTTPSFTFSASVIGQ